MPHTHTHIYIYSSSTHGGDFSITSLLYLINVLYICGEQGRRKERRDHRGKEGKRASRDSAQGWYALWSLCKESCKSIERIWRSF